jgi:hypothetical protein
MKKTIILSVMFTFAVSIFCGNVFAGEIVLFDFEQIPQDAKIKNIKLTDGVNGKAAKFNGYTSEWVENFEIKISRTLFVEAWICPQQYSFNYDAIVHQTDSQWKGLSFGMTYQGKIAAVLYADGKQQVCYSTAEVPLLKWSHIAMAYQEGKGIELFLNGKPVGKLSFAGQIIFSVVSDTEKHPLIIGHCPLKQLALYTAPKREENKGIMRFSGLLDELKITDKIPYNNDGGVNVEHLEKAGVQALQFPKLPGSEIKQGTFGAFYTRLKYDDDAWESLWRTSEHPDIVVRFPDKPFKFVFWRGTSYVPAVVSENNIWVTDQCVENASGLGECYEALSDKQCRYSHVRIIENTPSRCVVHWRYAVSNAENQIAREDEHGWGDWTDEYWTVYPDGIAVRKQILHSPYSKAGDVSYEFDEILPLNAAGTRNEDNLEHEAITIADMEGNSGTYSWKDAPPKAFEKTTYHPISLVNTKSQWKSFFIFHSQRTAKPWQHKTAENQSNFSWWSHWPHAQFKSWNIDAVRPDKVSCTALDATPFDKNRSREPAIGAEFGANNTTLVRSLVGSTPQKIESLVPLARSWNHAPKLELKSDGYENNGYDVYERSYRVTKKTATSDKMPLSFVVQASGQSPICNLALLIENIDKETAAVQLNGKDLTRGKDFETGFIRGLESGRLILWLPIKTASPIEVVLSTD